MRYFVSNPIDRRIRHRDGWHHFYNDFIGHDVKFFFPIDVVEEENLYIVSASLPGVKSEDLDIQIEKDVITIQGEIKKVEETGRYVHQERRSGNFRRTVHLSDVLDSSETEAELKDGVLILRVPKAEESLAKKIKVKSEK